MLLLPLDAKLVNCLLYNNSNNFKTDITNSNYAQII